MKKYLHIPLALLLIAVGIWGCTLNRPRPLLSCLPAGQWTAVSGSHMVPGQGADGELTITPGELNALMADVDVRPRKPFSGWTCETVLMHIAAGDTTLSVEVGQDRCITVARQGDLDGTRTCWRAENTALYEALLPCTEP